MKALESRIKKLNTIGLDRRLLSELLHTGLRCPAFNERMKYTLCYVCDDYNPLLRFPDLRKFFPFDTLVKLPGYYEETLLVCYHPLFFAD